MYPDKTLEGSSEWEKALALIGWVFVLRLVPMKEVAVHKLSTTCAVPPPHAVRVESLKGKQPIRQVWLYGIEIDRLTRSTVGVRVGDSKEVSKSENMDMFRNICASEGSTCAVAMSNGVTAVYFAHSGSC